MNEEQAKPQVREDTAQKVAQVLLWTFVISFCALLAVNAGLTFLPKPASGSINEEFSKGWLDMLRNATVLLGTALTTVIGYYFGQRESAIARSEAKNAENRARESKQEAQDAAQKAKRLKEQVDKITADIPAGMSEDFESVRASLPKKPQG